MTQYSGKIIRKNPVVPTQQSASGVWTLGDAASATKNNTWPVAGVPDPISRSVRLRSSATGYFSKTPASATNRRTWTWSGWVKRSVLNAYSPLFQAEAGGNTNVSIMFLSDNTLRLFQQVGGVDTFYLVTTSVYRDPSAWYHIVVAVDTTQATNTNRLKMYVNGVQTTNTSTLYPSQNFDGTVNNNVSHYIGAWLGAPYYFDGYMTEVNFIDGQALTPSSFGTTDAITGAWIPMPYTGTYGTNGFYLNFKDNSSTGALGLDYSGNGNSWTANNISLTAGTTYDSMVDVPTLWMPYNTSGDTGALVRGNYCTLNPLIQRWSVGSATVTEGNLKTTYAGSSNAFTFGTMFVTSGKWYFETTVTAIGTNTPSIGVASIDAQNTVLTYTATYNSDGTHTGTGANYATYTTNDVIGVALDCDGGTVAFYKNNALQGTVTLVSGTIGLTPFTGLILNSTLAFNFGQRPFTYTPPTGFKSLNTFNLPASTVSNGASYMAATTFTGNVSTQTITNTVNGISFQPDLVWLKSRSDASNHTIYDSVRGVNDILYPNLTVAGVFSANNLNSFNSNGFSLGASENSNDRAGESSVGWQWKAGGAAVTNNAGSISAQVSANPTAGFSVVTYTGTGANATVGHGLGVAPKMVILKPRSIVSSWLVWHTAFAGTEYIVLESTAAKATLAAMWNSTVPTSSVFSIGTNANVNQNAATFVAYCFSEVAGYSKFGSYTGNGSTDGPFVHCGFRPRWVMIKRTDSTGNWFIWDSSRNTSNTVNNQLYPDSNSAEQVQDGIDFLSNGFKIRFSSTFADRNANGGTYIYAVFAENPFKYSNAR